MNSLTSKRKPVSRLLLSLSSSSSSRSLCIALFSSSSSPPPSSASPSSPSLSPSPSPSSPSLPSSHRPYSSSPRRYDEDSRSVRVAVWWDFENCGVPNGSNPFKISQSIIAAARANGIKGPVQIYAFGDALCLSRVNQEALSTTGVNLFHVPNGGRNSADRSLLVDLMHWVTQNPPPAHIFLISSDRDFAGILHRLRMNNYNILLACKDGKNTPGVLCSAATIMWHWDELIKGQNLSGRHFNQPPDAPFNSWYGHYKGPLEDPYDVPYQQNNSKANDLMNTQQLSSPRPPQAPKEVLKHVRDIVNSHPKGLSIGDLRAELVNKMTIDKTYYGFKRFSALLMSMRRVVKVIDRADGNFLIRPVSPKSSDAIENDDTSTGPITENERWAAQMAPKADGETQSIDSMENVEPVLRVAHHDAVKEISGEEKVEETPEKVLGDLSGEGQFASAKKDDEIGTVGVQLVRSPMNPTEEQNYKSERGVLKRLWAKFFDSSIDVERTDVPDKFHMCSLSPKKFASEERPTPSEHEICGPNNALNVKSDKIADPEVSPGFVGKVISWFKSWRNEPRVNTPTEQLNEEQIIVDDSRKHEDPPQSKKHELFFKDAFWRAFESFFRGDRGSDIVLNSISREQFAKRLQTDGPWVLRSLKERDLLDLVGLLISEKKWIKEFPTQIPRFRIFLPPRKTSASVHPPHLNGISLNEKPRTMLSSIMQNKSSEKSRSEILVDCQKLLEELLQQNPEGFKMSIFKKMFLDKYGYSLDCQKLGYPKLASLLQIMPGVKVDCSCVYPDNVVYAPGIASLGSKNSSPGSDSEMSHLSQKDEDSESQWQELGPVTNSDIVRQEEQAGPSKINEDYKPSMTDDDDELSDPDEKESLSSSQLKAEGQTRKRVNEEDSSLLQILNDWHATKDENNPEGLVNCSKEEPMIKVSSTARKQRSQKSYTFVTNPLESSKDKLIDSVLGGLKKSGKSRVQQ